MASKRRRCPQAMTSLKAMRFDHPPKPDLSFTSSDLEDVVSHEDDLVVISIVTVGRKGHRVLVDQESSTNVMFWETFC